MKTSKELFNKRDMIEANFIFSLYNDISLLSEYKNVINGEDIITEDGMFYYGILQNMIKAGYQNIDNVSIYDYLSDKPNSQKGYEERGGWKTIQEIKSIYDIKNIDAYYDELCKSNLLIRLNNKGFDVISELNKFNEMTCEQVYDYFEYQLASISIDKIEKMHVEDLTTGYDEWIDEWDKGGDVGYPISSKMLNHQLLGVHRKNLLLHLMGIGGGKTTSAVHWYILPAIENQDVCIIANEQDCSAWRQMILSTVLFNKLGTKVEGFSRHKMLMGHYTQEQKDKMKEAAKWLEKQPGKIHFIETQDYSVVNIKRIMSKYSKINCGLFIVDTLKPMDDSSDRAWGEFSEVAKELFLQAKKLDVAVVATCQLSPEAMSRKFLDLTCIAKAKAIAETASQVVMARELSKEEREKIEPFVYEGKVKKMIKLDPNKSYIMVFTPKNRYGQINPQIIMERNLNFNTYHDIGWYECSYDNFSRK